MIKKETIELIVNTYDLPIKKRNKIIGIATERFEGFEGLEGVYRYINYLVERFHQTIYEERFFTRLDSMVNENSDTLFHELIYIPDYIEEDNQRDLKEKLKEWIKEKGPLVILGRPVIQMEPSIKLGRRKYNKNPLALFKKYEEFYRGKSRTEVFNFDSGMYESLRINNQLHMAIPQVIAPGSTTKISKEKEKEIIKTYKILKSPTKIAKKLNMSRATVDYYLVKKYQLRAPNKKVGAPGYSDIMINDIIECLKKCKKASRVAKCYGINRWTVIKHGRRAGVPILSRGGNIENILNNIKKYNAIDYAKGKYL
ncbi:MAG: hypothetical protein ABIF18_02825 [archaeon]